MQKYRKPMAFNVQSLELFCDFFGIIGFVRHTEKELCHVEASL